LKSKLVSLVLSMAVILGLMLVPAALPGQVGMVAASNNMTISVQPSLTKVGCAEAFSLTVEVDNPDAMPISIVAARLDFGTTCFNVTSITPGTTLPNVVLNQYSNGAGTIDYDAGMPMGVNTTSTSILVCTINCLSTCATGTSMVDFVYTGGPPPRKTAVEYGPTDYLEMGNMALMLNATVKCGSPQLTVDVVGSGTVTMDGSITPTVYPNTTSWSWDEVVSLLANPAAGWAFDNWSGTNNDGVNPTDVTMTDAKSVTAYFSELPCDLDVDPNDLNLMARWGGFEANDTVTISNDGGGTLCWQVGTPPSWSVGDTWSYMNTYDEAPPGNPFPNPYYNPTLPCPLNNTLLNLSVVGADADYYYGVADWPLADPQRTAKPGMFIPCCLQDATVVIDKCTLDYVQQLANLTLYLPGPTPGQALVSWSYDSCHGWPYTLGKAWNYNMTITDALGTTVTPAQAAVTAGPLSMGGFIDVMEITHGSPNLGGTIFMQQYWSDTARNFVYQWDGGTFVAPPLDQRILLSASIAALPPPAACVPPSWLSFDQMAGDCGIGGSDVLTVTANTSGLAVGVHNGSFCISGCCASVDSEVVNVTLTVTPATTIDVFRDLPADALDYDAEYPGDSFFVYVNFTAPVDDFNAVGMTDFAPAGWEVETNVSWCTPVADWTMSPFNKAEYAWAGPFSMGQTFVAKYQVTIPATASPGSNYWPDCTPIPCPPCSGSPLGSLPVWVEYWFDADGPFESCIMGEREKVVTVPGCEIGETRDVNGDVLDTVMVNLYEDDDVWEDNDSSSLVVVGNYTIAMYEDCADDTGTYYKIASKYCYYSVNTRPQLDGGSMPVSRNPAYPDYIDWSTPEKLAAGNVLNFVGDYGLVCKAASMSYAMESVNHMLFVPLGDDGITPEPDWQLSNWKAMESVHSWQFPCGCNC